MLKSLVSTVLLSVCWMSAAACQPDSVSRTSALYEAFDIRLLSEEAFQEDGWAQAVGAMVYGTPELIASLENISNCTGVVISQDLVLTAGHCLQREPFAYVFNPLKIATADAGEQSIKVEIAAPGMVRLKFEGTLIPEAESFIQDPNWLKLVYRDQQRDFAIYRSTRPLPVHAIDIFDSGSSEGRLALYGFPNGVPLSVAGPCHGIPGRSGVDVWHDCDSVGGSSGALLVNTDEQKPLGLHHFGGGINKVAYYAEKGEFETAAAFAEEREIFWKAQAQELDWKRAHDFWGCEERVAGVEPDYACVLAQGLNRALLFSDIRERLRAHAPDLHNELQVRSDVAQVRSSSLGKNG
jgi:hypothetical protein